MYMTLEDRRMSVELSESSEWSDKNDVAASGLASSDFLLKTLFWEKTKTDKILNVLLYT